MPTTRKSYEPVNQPTQAMATGAGAPPAGMPMVPQGGRTGTQMPMPIAGSSMAQQPPQLPLPMGPGGPMSPLNVGSQGMLTPDRAMAPAGQASRVPMDSSDVFGSMGGNAGGAQAGDMGGSQAGPQVLMRLMKMLGRI